MEVERSDSGNSGKLVRKRLSLEIEQEHATDTLAIVLYYAAVASLALEGRSSFGNQF